MNNSFDNQKDESHPLFTSGEWEGFYCYKTSSEQHKMLIDLVFSNLRITGSGIDDIAPFTWVGSYDLKQFKVKITKHYATHEVRYAGCADENGIWGTWELTTHHGSSGSPEVRKFVEAGKIPPVSTITGGFHIWPKKMGRTRSEQLEVKEESVRLREMFTTL